MNLNVYVLLWVTNTNLGSLYLLEAITFLGVVTLFKQHWSDIQTPPSQMNYTFESHIIIMNSTHLLYIDQCETGIALVTISTH